MFPESGETPVAETTETTAVLPATEEITVAEKPKQTAEEKKSAYERRIERGTWRQKLANLQAVDTAQDNNKDALEFAKTKGIDVSKEENKTNVEFVTELSRREAEKIAKKGRAASIQVSKEVLTDTLKEIGYKEGDPGFFAAGDFLFKRFGTENPGVFENRELIENELEKLAGSINPNRYKKKNGIQEAIVNKATTPMASTESRTQPNSSDSEIKQIAKSKGMTEAGAKAFLEQRSKIPKFLQ